jgi:hypothetical protein
VGVGELGGVEGGAAGGGAVWDADGLGVGDGELLEVEGLGLGVGDAGPEGVVVGVGVGVGVGGGVDVTVHSLVSTASSDLACISSMSSWCCAARSTF